MAKKTTTDRLELTAQKREVFGKKLGALRRDHKLPANIYGEDFPSTAITLELTDFNKLFRKAGETSVIYISLDGVEIPTLVHDTAVHPIDNRLLHVDFRKVNLSKKIEAQVPIVVTGESEAVTLHGGVLLHLVESLTVEALPAQLPSEISIDISGLKEVDAEIKISDLKKTGDYEFKDEPEKVLVKIAEHKEEEVTPQVEVTPAEVEGAVPAEGEVAPTAEGEAPAEGEKKETVEEKKPEDAKKD